MVKPKKPKAPLPGYSKRIASLREMAGMTNATAFARYMGFSQQQLYNYEHGLSRPKEQTWLKLQAAFTKLLGFHVTLDFLIAGHGTHEGPEPEPQAERRQRPRLVK